MEEYIYFNEDLRKFLMELQLQGKSLYSNYCIRESHDGLVLTFNICYTFFDNKELVLKIVLEIVIFTIS